MKFKEVLDRNSVVHQDDIDKLFDKETANVLLELEKTIQDWI